MAYIGHGKINPNHPFAHLQITFGAKPPVSLTSGSEKVKTSETSQGTTTKSSTQARSRLGATISVYWPDDWHSIVLTPRNWAKVKAGAALWIRGRGYRYEGEFFWDKWQFGGGLDGKLIVWYGDGGGQGFVGKLRDTEIREYEWQGAAKAPRPRC